MQHAFAVHGHPVDNRQQEVCIYHLEHDQGTAEIVAAIRAGKIKLNAAKPGAQDAGAPVDPLDF